jgi:hypothetical protein
MILYTYATLKKLPESCCGSCKMYLTCWVTEISGCDWAQIKTNISTLGGIAHHQWLCSNVRLIETVMLHEVLGSNP